MQISASMVKELRDRTGAGMMDCKKALIETEGNVDKALDFLRKSGIAKAEKKVDRKVKEGVIYTYIHPGNKLGALVEINCETDFVANTDNFMNFVKDIAMQVAASAPTAVTREEISTELIEKEKNIYLEQAKKEGKPEHIAEKMVTGRIEKFFKETVLLEQPFIKDPDKNIETHLKETIGKLGENITITRFSRFALGESF
ncbi:MAG: translation elongation factor Ts [Candidatus Marinimicrobia bacterium]|nr:translation elongation factor Ts [Candidatus Neomarinimicrobiota bacterium]